jgi:hypothetical protein
VRANIPSRPGGSTRSLTGPWSPPPPHACPSPYDAKVPAAAQFNSTDRSALCTCKPLPTFPWSFRARPRACMRGRCTRVDRCSRPRMACHFVPVCATHYTLVRPASALRKSFLRNDIRSEPRVSNVSRASWHACPENTATIPPMFTISIGGIPARATVLGCPGGCGPCLQSAQTRMTSPGERC